MDHENQWLEDLYQETGTQLLSYLLKRVGNRGTAEDLLQETFAAALRHPDRLRNTVSSRAYLFGIARNLSASTLRKSRVAEPIPLNLPAEETPDDPRLEALRMAIPRLKEEFREVLELRLTHELSYEEIADALQVPVGTIRSRLHHAVNQLRQVIRHVDTDLSIQKGNV
jgi:RNA polymerase sigma-70 factor, ECF subfamily